MLRPSPLALYTHAEGSVPEAAVCWERTIRLHCKFFLAHALGVVIDNTQMTLVYIEPNRWS